MTVEEDVNLDLGKLVPVESFSFTGAMLKV